MSRIFPKNFGERDVWGIEPGDRGRCGNMQCAVGGELYTICIWDSGLLIVGVPGVRVLSICNCMEACMLLSIAVVSVAIWAAVGAFVALLVWS